MVTIDDVLFHIAQNLRLYEDADQTATIEEFVLSIVFDLHIAITTDVEETELDFLERYGRGHTFYFKLKDYEHGKLLAGQMYWILLGTRPDMDAHIGDRFKPEDRLYLFVHVRNIQPPPLTKESPIAKG